MITQGNPRTNAVVIGLAIAIALLAAVALVIVQTMPVRAAVATYMDLIGTANRPDLSDQDRIARARGLCSTRYLSTHELAVAPEGGLVGIPRNIHKNFQAWKREGNVWVCPTNRVGPIYQFVPEEGHWRFDGLVGLLQPRGKIVPATDLPAE